MLKTQDIYYLLHNILLISIVSSASIFCEKKSPEWIKYELMISGSDGESKGYSTEIVSIYPSKSLALIKCENESKAKMSITIQAEIEKYIKKILNYDTIKKDLEKQKIYSNFIRQLSKNLAHTLRERMNLEEIYTDEKNGVMYCRSSLKFDREFYIKFKEETLNLLEQEGYSVLKNDETSKRLEAEIEKKLKTLKQPTYFIDK